MLRVLMRWFLLFAVGLIFLLACIFNPGLAWSMLVLGGGGWIALRWFRKRREALHQAEIAAAITRCVEIHRAHLSRTREEGVFLDEYGKLEDSAWRQEVAKFTRRVIFDEIPEARTFSERSMIEFTRNAIERALGPASPQSRLCGF